MELHKKFDVVYYKNPRGEGEQFSHKYTEVWDKTEFHCPRCSSKEVWQSSGADYYVGEQMICTHCKATFYLPMGISDITDRSDSQRLSHLTEQD